MVTLLFPESLAWCDVSKIIVLVVTVVKDPVLMVSSVVELDVAAADAAYATSKGCAVSTPRYAKHMAVILEPPVWVMIGFASAPPEAIL